MAFKFANEIINDIKSRGPISVPIGSVTGEEFERWLYVEDILKVFSIERMISLHTVDNIFHDNYGDAA